MKKLLIALIVLGLIAIGTTVSNADSTRTIPHNFRAFAADTEGIPGGTIYRITGVATGSNSVFGIYNVATLEEAAVTVCAVEGGEATSGDPLPHYYFGEEGLQLNAGFTVVVYNCTIVVEYL